MRMSRLVLVSAPGALSTCQDPVGGGVRILELLAGRWAGRHEVVVLTAGSRDGEEEIGGVRQVRLGLPSLAGGPERRLLDFGAFAYARFSEEFEKRATAWLLERASGVPVLCNDIAEGPDFGRLADAGFRMVTLFHVVVADFFSRIYLRDWVKPAQVGRLLDSLRRWRLSVLVPRIPRLVFQKEGRAVARSAALVVPSTGMADALAGAFPAIDRSRLHVIPWGWNEESPPEAEVAGAEAELREEYHLDGDARVVMTLSRLSHEKGIELLLSALERLEGQAGPRITALVCGAGAYMGGADYVRRLQRQAAGLRRARVIFPGYLTGARKAAHFRLAHLFVNCSRYEAYGLAIAEALRAGLPVLSADHYGSRDLVRAPYGEIVARRDAGEFAARLAALLADPAALAGRGLAAREAGAGLSFAAAADRIEGLLLG